MIEARNISFVIDKHALLEDVSLSISAGETVALIGPNGAGKSTLRKVLSGDWKPTSGDVFINKRNLCEWSVRELSHVRAVLPQDSTLNFPFSVLEVALMGRTPHINGVESVYDLQVTRAALDLAEVRHLEERLYTTLSGGERQRVQLARVLAQIWDEPKEGSRYLLLDEPTSNLDLSHQHQTLSIARRFAKEGAGVLVILHDLNLAAQYANRIVMMNAGKIVAMGSPQDVLKSQIIQDVFSIPVIVEQNPHHACPMIIPSPQSDNF